MTNWKTEIPTEEDEQKKLAEYLDMNNYCWCHVPNEGKHKVQYRAKQKKLGLKSGVPDCLIFDVPDKYNDLINPGFGINGIAIELKRQKGGQVSESQAEWIGKLDARRWLTRVAYGADEAIEWLEDIFEEGENE